MDGKQLGDVVDWAMTIPIPSPAATGVSISSTPRAGDTYVPGETIRVAVAFDQAVDIGGTPRIELDIDPAAGAGEVWAAYEGGSGTADLTFSHVVAAADISDGGVAVAANSLEANGGTIRSKATGQYADLSHAGLAPDPKHKADGRLSPPEPTAPVFDDGAAATLSIDENQADGAAVGAVAATDEDGDALSYSLSGADAASFAIGADSAITVRSGMILDHETKASYAFTAEVTDGQGRRPGRGERPGHRRHHRGDGRGAERGRATGRADGRGSAGGVEDEHVGELDGAVGHRRVAGGDARPAPVRRHGGPCAHPGSDVDRGRRRGRGDIRKHRPP